MSSGYSLCFTIQFKTLVKTGLSAGLVLAIGATGATGPAGAGGDGPVAYAALALATTTAATLGGYIVTNNASQSAQDALIATNTADIATDEGRITLLEVKTTDQTWGSLTGTTFSGRVNVGITADGVVLNTGAICTFGSGISSSAAITSSAGTSQFSSLLINTTAEITNDLTITNGEIYVTRNTLTSTKKMVLYDNTTGNDYDYLGFWTDSGTASKKFLNAEIDGVAGSAFQWYAGDGAGTSRTLLKQLTSTVETGFTPSVKFLKTPGFSQEINLLKDAPNNTVKINMLGDTGGANAFDGQIIQEQGNGVDDNRGLMTIQSGGIAINALSAGLNIQATTSTLIQSGTTTTLTSGGETEINCDSLDINIVGLTTIDTQGITITGTGAGAQPDLILTNPTSGVFQIASATDQDLLFGINGAADFYVQSDRSVFIEGTAGDINLTATDINLTTTGVGAGELVVRANTNIDLKTLTGRIDIDSDQGIGLTAGAAITTTSVTTTTLTAGTDFSVISTTGDINLTTATGNTFINSTLGSIDLTSATTIQIQSGTTTLIQPNDNFTVNAVTGLVDIYGTTTMDLGSGGAMTLDSGGDMRVSSQSNIDFQIGGNTRIDILDATLTFNPTTTILNQINAVDKLSITNTTTTMNQTTSISNRIGGNDRLTITNTNVTANPTTQFLAEIGGVDKLTITSTATTLDVDNTFNMMPTATIIQNMSATIPAGFLYCNGANISRTTYARLFAAIGTAFGVGDGSTTFGKPNLMGAYLRGASNQTVGGVVYTGPAIGTAQQDSVLAPNNRGFYNVDSGGGGASRQVRSRPNIGTDPNDTSTAQTTNFARENTTENRVFNYSVYYYIRY
jgi:hypothetical protein